MKRLTLLLVLFGSTLHAADCPAAGSTVELFGTMGKDLDVSMKLVFEKNRLTGTYMYMKFEHLNVVKDSDQGAYSMELKPAKTIALSGTCTAGSLSLQESDSKGKPTGTFQGSLTAPQAVEGTWSTSDGKKTLPFHLQAIAPTDHVSGKYRTADLTQELDVRLDGNQVHIEGEAYWLNSNTGSVHTGDAEGAAKLEGDTVHFLDENNCSMTIRFAGSTLEVSDSARVCGGANVTFDGTYERVGPPAGNLTVQSSY